MNLVHRTATVSTKKEKVTIERTVDSVEVDLDFTQLYNCFFLLSLNINSGSSFHIMFYLLQNMDKNNMIVVNSHLLKRFQGICIQMGKKPISEQSFYSCLKELQKAKVMEKLSKGQYFMNVYAMWKDDKNKRIEYIKAENGEGGQRFAYNPLQLLLPKEIPTQYEMDTMQPDEIHDGYSNTNVEA